MLHCSNSTLMNGDYLSNGNGKADSNDNNGSASTVDDLANSNTESAADFTHPPASTPNEEFARRDNVEDELDAEMTDVHPSTADSEAVAEEASSAQEAHKPEDEFIKDEMITEDHEEHDTSEKTEGKLPDQSDNEEAPKPQGEIEQESTVSNEAEVSQDQKQPEIEEAKADGTDDMEVETTPPIADSSSSAQVEAAVTEVEEKIESPTSSEDNNVAAKEGNVEEKIISSSADDETVANAADNLETPANGDSAPESSSTSTNSNEASVSESM